jgi:6,7-dimethyl-8-ribityllumazine synthase
MVQGSGCFTFGTSVAIDRARPGTADFIHHSSFAIQQLKVVRSDNIQEVEPNHDGSGLAVGIVMSRFNNDIGEGLLSSCTSTLLKHGLAPEDVRIVTVPGALEVPLALRKMAQSGDFDALIALGAVVRGETYHFEIVANESCSGIASVQLESGVPIANGILTTDTDDQALQRMMQKGADCALAAIEMANLLRTLDS